MYLGIYTAFAYARRPPVLFPTDRVGASPPVSITVPCKSYASPFIGA